MRGQDLKVPSANEWGRKRVDFYVNQKSRTREDGDLNEEEQELLDLEEEDAIQRQHKLDSLNALLDYKKLASFAEEASDSGSDEEDALVVQSSSTSNSKLQFGPSRTLKRITLTGKKSSVANEPEAQTLNNDQAAKKRKSVSFDLEKRAAPQLKKQKKGANFVEGWDEEPMSDDDERRQITDEIQKNKGLIQKRKKEIKHSRVKRRQQYKKALIKRRSQVPDVKHEATKYTGESRGIRMSTVRSIPFKS